MFHIQKTFTSTLVLFSCKRTWDLDKTCEMCDGKTRWRHALTRNKLRVATVPHETPISRCTKFEWQSTSRMPKMPLFPEFRWQCYLSVMFRCGSVFTMLPRYLLSLLLTYFVYALVSSPDRQSLSARLPLHVLSKKKSHNLQDSPVVNFSALVLLGPSGIT